MIGDTPGYNFISRYISQIWNSIAKSDLYYHEDGYYVVRFQSMADLNEFIYSGSYTVNNRSLVLKHWSPQFDSSVEFLTEIPFGCVSLNCP